MPLLVQRGDEQLSMEIAARFEKGDGDDAGRWLLGILPQARSNEAVLRRHGPVQALGASVEYNVTRTRQLLGYLGGLLKREVSVKGLSGPVEIAVIASQTLLLGMIPTLHLVAFISLNLGIMNLLPIPILDGGRMVVVAVEGLRGRALELDMKLWILRVGLVMILILMGGVLLLDLIKAIER